uniref:Uncharacterized protein n=1 Tax=Arundo donax TaxID=35708 RepID=A0A0A8YKF6_ARUDO
MADRSERSTKVFSPVSVSLLSVHLSLLANGPLGPCT